MVILVLILNIEYRIIRYIEWNIKIIEIIIIMLIFIIIIQ